MQWYHQGVREVELNGLDGVEGQQHEDGMATHTHTLQGLSVVHCLSLVDILISSISCFQLKVPDRSEI